MNQDKISNPNHVAPGTILTVRKSLGFMRTERPGDLYEIRVGDTLGTISTTLYGTTEHWKKLWKYNGDLVNNPNQIYAGFSLYYLPKDRVSEMEGKSYSRNVAGQ